jgi:phage terminase small subunit
MTDTAKIPATKKYTRKQCTALSKLTPKQRRLVTLLPTATNGTEAGIQAGYGKGINRDSARATVSETLAKPNVQEAMIQLYDENKVKQVISKWLDCDTGTHALKAAELAARTLAMLTDRQQVEDVTKVDRDETRKHAANMALRLIQRETGT